MIPNKTLVVGVTGNSGSGKGSLGRILQGEGAFLADCDCLAHEAIAQGAPAYYETIELFGEGILDGGAIDRKKLGGIVFRDPGKKKALEKAVHRRVIEAALLLTEDAAGRGARLAVWDAPLLIEAEMHKMCDFVAVVTASFDKKIERICIRDNISREAAILRLKSQPAQESLIEWAVRDLGRDRVFEVKNDLDEANLEGEAMRLLEILSQRFALKLKPNAK
ncbi:MAG: dephospho-CoA kinase [Clostridiales bacterium]|nr:dephospho-CoA kinase [Clostridiales bacterium]